MVLSWNMEVFVMQTNAKGGQVSCSTIYIADMFVTEFEETKNFYIMVSLNILILFFSWIG